MTKERIVKELSKVREQLAGLQARERDLAEQLQMAEDAEKMNCLLYTSDAADDRRQRQMCIRDRYGADTRRK